MTIFLKTVTAYRCDRCGNEWLPRKNGAPLPTVCPKCKSPYWNKPRGRSKAPAVAAGDPGDAV